jgi:hypothetical protein
MTDFAWACFVRGMSIGFGLGVMVTVILHMLGEKEDKKKKGESK